jgi:hypothetical protein
MFDPEFGQMTRRDRDDLAKVVRLRAKVAKEAAAQRKADLLADFEAQLASEYAYDDDETWRQATEAAQQAVQVAEKLIAERCAELGIPKRFRPGLNVYWHGRGENASRERRAELRTVAKTRLDAMEKEARATIDARAADIQAKILAGGLETAEARAFAASLPTAEALMPPLDIKALRAVRGERPRYGLGGYALTDGDDSEAEDDAGSG